MRAIKKPLYAASAVFAMCVDSIEDDDLRTRLNGIALDVANAALDYEAKANSANLFTIPSHTGNNASVVLGGVTKGELKSVYTQHMVGAGKPARVTYEELRDLSKLCPLCGFGYVRTLDHYLPKAKYPLYSVLPSNLVPSCGDCNTGKLASSASSAEGQSIHPYFDPTHFFSEQWVFAEVRQTVPVTVKFFAAPPNSWDIVSQSRAASHLENFNLSARYSVQAADQLAILRYQLRNFSDGASRREHLRQYAESCKIVHKNSWQTAFHQALANSEWYCETGFEIG